MAFVKGINPPLSSFTADLSNLDPNKVPKPPGLQGNQSGAFIGPGGARAAGSATVSFNSATEAGHGKPTVEQQNTAIRAGNAPIEASIAELETKQKHLQKLFSHELAKGDGVLTKGELQRLATESTDPAQKEAALWLLSRPDIYASLPKKGTTMGGDGAVLGMFGTGVDVYASSNFVADLTSQIASQKKMLKPLIDVPAPNVPAPGAGSTPPVATTNGTPTPATDSTAATGTPKNFSSGVAGLGEAIDGINGEISALIEDTKKNPANANANQAKISQLSNQMTTLSALMNQIFTMQSNLSKMLSEMAMTAVRNMR